MKYEDISKNGYPLGFLIKKAESNTNGLNKTFTSHTRQMDILQKESIGYEGDLNSTSFRLTSDEGKHLNGTDLAPFPLGFFNASIHGDIVGTVMKQATSQGLRIDNIDVLSAGSLGATVTYSELQKVGVLKNLHTTGDFNFDEGWVTWDSGLMRLSIGRELPNGQLSVSSNEAEFVVDPWFDTVKVGTYTTSNLEIVTDDTPRISIEKTGTINITSPVGIKTASRSDADLAIAGPIAIQNKKIQYNVEAPTEGSHLKGDITYNTNPDIYRYVGWVCVREGSPGVWKPFGRIEE